MSESCDVGARRLEKKENIHRTSVGLYRDLGNTVRKVTDSESSTGIARVTRPTDRLIQQRNHMLRNPPHSVFEEFARAVM